MGLPKDVAYILYAKDIVMLVIIALLIFMVIKLQDSLLICIA